MQHNKVTRLIIKWFKKNLSTNQQAHDSNKVPKAAKSNNEKKSATHTNKNRKPARPVNRKKNSKSDWNIKNFVVEPVEGKTRFHDLHIHDQILQAIQASGFSYCTPIQAETLPHTLKGVDLIGKAQTGTGKTAAFLITIIDQILCYPITEKRYQAEPRALIIAPTRELVKQIEDDAKALTRFTGLSVVSMVGGEKFDKQESQLNSGFVDILVATPGRLIDFMQQKKVYIDRIEILVLDEADRMLDMGFIPQVKQIVRATPQKMDRQTLLFSATFNQDIINLSSQWTVDPVTIEIEPEHVATVSVNQINYMVSDNEKVKVIANLVKLDEVRHCIIFTNRRDQSQKLQTRLAAIGCKAGLLTGEIQQSKRTQTLKAFKEGKIKVLIATDVVGRGIHIDGITHVINFNLPQEPENYVHRIGRTGRAGSTGTAINLIGEEDAYDLPDLEKLLGHKLELEIPPDNLLK